MIKAIVGTHPFLKFTLPIVAAKALHFKQYTGNKQLCTGEKQLPVFFPAGSWYDRYMVYGCRVLPAA
ncbi:MAG: hypothetical protein IKK08_08050 [Clostridia bacterium]|nr:hypothetical protein [Clostridia bacterium]